MTLERIVSLEPSITATLVALGQRRRLVAVSRHCARLTDVENLPCVGTTWCVDADEVAAFSPDLVLAGTPYQAGVVDSLLRRRLNVLCLYPQTMSDVYAHIRWLGRLCAVGDVADRLVMDIGRALASFAAAAHGMPAQRVYVEVWPDPPISASPWVSELVNAMGGMFVPDPAGRQVTAQEMLAVDPQAVFLAWADITPGNIEQVKSRPGWERVSAIRSDRVVVLDELLVNAPGPNLVSGMREIWRALYPNSPVPIPG